MSLQELCINCIISDFDRYYLAYSTTTDKNLQLKFHFLQKFYSVQILHRLFQENLLEEKYADFVFNKYLKSIETQCFITFSSSTIIDIFARIGPSIEKVIFDEEYCDMEWIKDVICYLPNVSSISHEYSSNNGILEKIAKFCPKLENLNVNFSFDVNEDGINYFLRNVTGELPCPLLKEILLGATLVPPASVKCLLNDLPFLQKVDHYDVPVLIYSMHEHELGSLDKVRKYNLTELNFPVYTEAHFVQFQKYEEMLELCITVCPNLKSFSCPIYKLEHLNLCSMLPDVEHLNLKCLNDTSFEVNDIMKEKGRNLTSVTLQNFSVSFSVLGESCLRLSQLTIDDVNIQFNENDYIPTLHNLKEFIAYRVDLSNSDYSSAVSRLLTSSPNMEELRFVGCNFINMEMKHTLLQCCERGTLKYIFFDGTTVEEAFLESIVLTCSSLQILNSKKQGMGFALDLYKTAQSMPNKPEIRFDNYVFDEAAAMSDDYLMWEDYSGDPFDDYDIDYMEL